MSELEDRYSTFYFLGSLLSWKGTHKFHLIPGQEGKELVTYADTSATKASTLTLDSVTLSSELPLFSTVNRIFCSPNFIFSWQERNTGDSGTLFYTTSNALGPVEWHVEKSTQLSEI